MPLSIHRSAPILLVSSALIAASFIPTFLGASFALRIGAALLASASLVLSVLQATKHRRASATSISLKPRGIRWLEIVALLIGGVLIGTFVTDVPAASASTRGIESPAAVIRGTVSNVPSLDPLNSFATSQAALTPIRGGEKSRLIDMARDRDETPLSGLEPDYQRAQAFAISGGKLVSVPLLGTDLPEISSLTFVWTETTLSVIENASSLVDAEHAVSKSWTNHALSRDLHLVKSGAEPQTNAEPRGFSMERLKKCLNDNGVGWAALLLVSAACGLACATAVLCLPCAALYAGIASGAVGKCVNYAFA